MPSQSGRYRYFASGTVKERLTVDLDDLHAHVSGPRGLDIKGYSVIMNIAMQRREILWQMHVDLTRDFGQRLDDVGPTWFASLRIHSTPR